MFKQFLRTLLICERETALYVYLRNCQHNEEDSRVCSVYVVNTLHFVFGIWSFDDNVIFCCNNCEVDLTFLIQFVPRFVFISFAHWVILHHYLYK